MFLGLLSKVVEILLEI